MLLRCDSLFHFPPRIQQNQSQKKKEIISLFLLGDTVNIHSDQSLRVLPPGGWNHTAYVFGSSFAREISHIRHDISLIKVSYWSLSTIEKKISLYLY